MYGTLHDALSWARSNLETIALISGIVISVVVFVILIALSIISHQEWVVWCEDQGGRIISDTDTQVGTGIDAEGNVVTTTTTSTDYYCLNENGGIIDIR